MTRARLPQVCLVSREVYPLTGGGIGSYVTALAALLRDIAEVRVVTSDAHEERWRKLRAERDARLPDGLLWTFVPEPSFAETDDWLGFHHLWSARVLETLEREYGRHGPDLIEFPDYHAEGVVTLQAKRADHPTLRDTLVALRAHTSFEMCRTLDGWVGEDREARAVVALEREALRMADVLLWAGGDVLGTYRRFYGELPADVRIGHPLDFTPRARFDDSGFEARWPVRFLYVGRLERRKGVQDLVRALMANDSDAWQLTFVGGDTETAPLGVSQQAQLELMTLGDERVHFAGELPRDDLRDVVREHDVLVMPSRWECWPTVVLEAMALNRPVVATPTGGMIEMIRPGSGWLTTGTDSVALRPALERLIGDPGEIATVIRAHGPQRRGRELAEVGDVRAGYARLLDRPTPPARLRARPLHAHRAAPLVSVVVPYYGLPDYLSDALDSVAAQTYSPIETVVVNDGSRNARDAEVLADAAGRPRTRVLTTPNRGLGGARNAGVVQSRGRYFLPLDADNVLGPTFVERCVELLERDPSIAYVTSWSQYIDEDGRPILHASGFPRGYHPIGNRTPMVTEANTAGDALAVIPRRLFDLGFRYTSDVPICEDWMLYRSLRRHARYGVVIPERLVGYRVRADSMYHVEEPARIARVREEASTQLTEVEISWTP